MIVGKIVDKDGARSFVKMSAAMAESSAVVVSSAGPKKSDKPEGGVAVSSKRLVPSSDNPKP